MDWPPWGRSPQDQATRVRHIVSVLFDNLTSIQRLQDLLGPDQSERLGLHLPPGVIGEATIPEAFSNLVVLHRSLKSTSDVGYASENDPAGQPLHGKLST